MTPNVLPYASAAPRERTAGDRYVLLGLLCLAAVIAYVQRSGIAMAAENMQRELSLDKIQFGAVMAAWSIGYAIAMIPSGWLADRWGTRRALTLFAIVWSVATGCVAGARGYHSLLTFRHLVSHMNTCGSVGAAVFPLAVGWLVERTKSWNLVMFAFAGIFAVDAVCWAILNPKKPLFEEE